MKRADFLKSGFTLPGTGALGNPLSHRSGFGIPGGQGTGDSSFNVIFILAGDCLSVYNFRTPGLRMIRNHPLYM